MAIESTNTNNVSTICTHVRYLFNNTFDDNLYISQTNKKINVNAQYNKEEGNTK